MRLLLCVCWSVELLFLLKCFLSGIKFGALCPRVSTKFLLSPPQNHIRIMDPLNSKGLPPFSSFSPSSTKPRLCSVIKKAPFDLEINFQINSGTQGACRAACTPEQGVVWWHQLRINPKFRHIPERQQHQMRQVFVGLNSFVEI